MCVCVCVCVCMFHIKLLFPLFTRVLVFGKNYVIFFVYIKLVSPQNICKTSTLQYPKNVFPLVVKIFCVLRVRFYLYQCTVKKGGRQAQKDGWLNLKISGNGVDTIPEKK